MLEFGHMTHPGHCRVRNEDTYYGDLDNGLWLIADGMGGQGRGERASAIVRDTIVTEVFAGHRLEDAIRMAHQAIISARGNQIMGSSVIALQVQQNRYEIAWVGDTQAFVWDEHQLSSVNALYPRHAQQGDHGPNAAVSQSKTHALGITDPTALTMSSLSGHVSAGMQWLLCSDGLGDQLDQQTMETVLQQVDVSAQECVDILIATALENGGSDNLTALLIRAP